MPVITVVGKRFQISSDFMPFLALVGFVTHSMYFIIFGAIFLISKPGGCPTKGSPTIQEYSSVLSGTLAFFGLTMLIEVVLFFIGIRGTPFQESKRRWMVPALYVRAVVWISQAAFNVYSTVIVERVKAPSCFKINDRQVDLRVMVYMAWVFIFFNWLRVYIVYILFPDYQDVQSWRRHARIMVFGCFKNKDSRDIKQQLKNEGKKPLKRTTRVFSNMLKHLDLSPTDQVVGLILLSALQRRRRGIHISAMLRPEIRPNHTSLAELRAARGTSIDIQGNDLEGRLERLLTGDAITEGDLTTVLEGLRETRAEVEDALAADPEAAKKLATEGASAALEHGILSETASRMLRESSSFKRTSKASNTLDALERMSSTPADFDEQQLAVVSARSTAPPALRSSSSGGVNVLAVHSDSVTRNKAQTSTYGTQPDTVYQAGRTEPPHGSNQSNLPFSDDTESPSRPCVESQQSHSSLAANISSQGLDQASTEPSYNSPTAAAQPTSAIDRARLKAFGRSDTQVPGAMGDKRGGFTNMFKSVGGFSRSREVELSIRGNSETSQLSEAELQHEKVLAEAIAETDPAIAQRAAEVEIARGAPERARLAVDALQKVATKSQRQPGAPAGGSCQEAARGPADGSGRPAEEAMSFSAPPGDNNDVALSEEDQAAATTAAMVAMAAEEARETVKAAGMDQPGVQPSKEQVRKVAEAAVNLLEAQLGTALTAVQQRAATGELSGEHAVAEVGHQIALSNLNTFLTPSSIAAELRPDLTPAKAADIYTGRHKQVNRDTILEARIYAKYATAVYGASFAVWLDGSNKYVAWTKLLLHRGWNAYKANEINAPRIKSLGQHLDYEAIIQYSGIDDDDLLYFSYTNQALGVLPYIIVLDHATKSVVLAIRGSASTADWVTDFMGVPEDAGGWISDQFRKEHPDLGTCTAHSGMLIAAAAVWEDLEEHGILATLLNSTHHEEDDGDESSSSDRSIPLRTECEDRGGSVKRGGQGAESADGAAHSSARGVSFLEGQPADVKPNSNFKNEEAESRVPGPEGIGRKSDAQVKDSANVKGKGRGSYVAAIMKRGLHKEGWKLVVTGHSLGAGVAALISLKLRTSFPKVRCWAFCPPGGLVSANLSAAMSPWCTSIMCGKDAISRVSLPNLAGMIDETLIAIARCKQPTCKVLLNTMCKSTREQTIDKILFAPEDVPAEALERLKHYQSLKPQQQELLLQMLPPGRAIFLRRLKAKVDRKQRHAQKKAAKLAAAKEMQEQRAASKLRRRAEKDRHKKETAARAQSLRRVFGGKLNTSMPHSASALATPTHEPDRPSNNKTNAGVSRDGTTGTEKRQRFAKSRLGWVTQSPAAAAAVPSADAGKTIDSASKTTDSSSRTAQHTPSARVSLPPAPLDVLPPDDMRPALEQQPESGTARSPFANLSVQSRVHQGHGSSHHVAWSDRQTDEQSLTDPVGLQSVPSAGSLTSVFSSDTDVEDVRIDVMSDSDTEADEESQGNVSGKWLYERRWDAVWIHPREIVDEGILISPRMTSDHYTTSLIGALQAVLSGGQETGTLEQQAGGAKVAASYTPIDRLQSLANKPDSESFSALSEEAARAASASASGRSGKAVDIGGSTSYHRTGPLGLAAVGSGQRSGSRRQGKQGGEARNAVIDIMPG